MILDRINEVEPLVLEVIGGSRWEHQKCRAVMSVGDDRHVGGEILAVPGVESSFHMVFERMYRFSLQDIEGFFTCGRYATFGSELVYVNNNAKISLLRTHFRKFN